MEMNPDYDNFIDCLRKSRILESSFIDGLLNDFCQEHPGLQSSFKVAQWLIDRGRITTWQAEKLRNNRFKGFFLDDYLLLDCLGAEYDFTRYRARHLPTTRMVALRIYRPWNEAGQRPGIRYELESES